MNVVPIVDLPHALPNEALLPTAADPEFDRMAALTRRVLDAPVALVSLPNRRCQVFPGASGVSAEMDAARSNGLEFSYCQYVVRSGEPLVVTDARLVPQLVDNRSNVDLGLISYAGMPLRDDRGRAVGSLCVLDTVPREWTERDLQLLGDLAAACSSQLQLRVVNARAAVSADRDRIGQEFGQGVIRELFALSMTLGSLRSRVTGAAARELTSAIETVDGVIVRIRDSIYDVGR